MSEARPKAIAEGDQGRRKRIGTRVLDSLRGGSSSIPDSRNSAVLPEPIRYAMAHRGARLLGRDVETLHRVGLPRPAFYLAMKAASGHDAVQTEMLQRLAGLKFDYDRLSIEDIRPGTDRLDRQPGVNAVTVGGEKLGQFSRHGFTGDLDAFDRTLTTVLADRPKAPVFMVANYPYIAIDVLAEHSLERGNPLGVINPDVLGRTGSAAGFMIRSQVPGFTVEPLGQDFAVPEGSVIFDDVLREGKTRDAVMAWAGRTAADPTFVTATTQPVEAQFF
jgi:hypothetical protein